MENATGLITGPVYVNNTNIHFFAINPAHEYPWKW